MCREYGEALGRDPRNDRKEIVTEVTAAGTTSQIDDVEGAAKQATQCSHLTRQMSFFIVLPARYDDGEEKEAATPIIS